MRPPVVSFATEPREARDAAPAPSSTRELEFLLARGRRTVSRALAGAPALFLATAFLGRGCAGGKKIWRQRLGRQRAGRHEIAAVQA